jgi:Regulator of ribonuclease activity B
LSKGETEVVSNQPVPDWAKSYPMMRHSDGADATGKTHSWTILRGDTPLTVENLKKAPKYKVLSPELEKFSIDGLWSHPLLVKRLAEGWTPERDEELRLEAIAQKEAENRLAPQTKAALNRSVRHYLYFPEKANAEKAAQWFRSQGFSVDVRLGGDNENWLALVKHETPDSQQDLEKLREEMGALAERLNGEYDGWEVAL